MATQAMCVHEINEISNWQDRAKDLNERAKSLIDEAMQALQDFANGQEGEIFTKLCDLGNQVIDGMTKVFEGMQQLFDAVSEIKSTIQSVLDGLLEGIVNVARSSIGGC